MERWDPPFDRDPFSLSLAPNMENVLCLDLVGCACRPMGEFFGAKANMLLVPRSGGCGHGCRL